MKLELSRQAFENIQISSFVKIRPIGAELSHAVGRKEGRTDGRTERETRRSLVAFRNFPKASKKEFRFQMHSYHSNATSTNHASATQLVLRLNYVSSTCKGNYYYTFISIKFHIVIRTATAN